MTNKELLENIVQIMKTLYPNFDLAKAELLSKAITSSFNIFLTTNKDININGLGVFTRRIATNGNFFDNFKVSQEELQNKKSVSAPTQITRLAVNQTRLDYDEVNSFFNLILEEIKQSLLKHESIKIDNFGSFKVLSSTTNGEDEKGRIFFYSDLQQSPQTLKEQPTIQKKEIFDSGITTVLEPNKKDVSEKNITIDEDKKDNVISSDITKDEVKKSDVELEIKKEDKKEKTIVLETRKEEKKDSTITSETKKGDKAVVPKEQSNFKTPLKNTEKKSNATSTASARPVASTKATTNKKANSYALDEDDYIEKRHISKIGLVQIILIILSILGCIYLYILNSKSGETYPVENNSKYRIESFFESQLF